MFPWTDWAGCVKETRRDAGWSPNRRVRDRRVSPAIIRNYDQLRPAAHRGCTRQQQQHSHLLNDNNPSTRTRVSQLTAIHTECGAEWYGHTRSVNIITVFHESITTNTCISSVCTVLNSDGWLIPNFCAAECSLWCQPGGILTGLQPFFTIKLSPEGRNVAL